MAEDKRKYNKGNPQNLINLKDRTPEERHELAVKGGQAAALIQKERKSLRLLAKEIGQLKITNKYGEELTKDAVIIMLQYNKAMLGDVKSAKFIAELLGEMLGIEDNTQVQNIINLKID